MTEEEKQARRWQWIRDKLFHLELKIIKLEKAIGKIERRLWREENREDSA